MPTSNNNNTPINRGSGTGSDWQPRDHPKPTPKTAQYRTYQGGYIDPNERYSLHNTGRNQRTGKQRFIDNSGYKNSRTGRTQYRGNGQQRTISITTTANTARTGNRAVPTPRKLGPGKLSLLTTGIGLGIGFMRGDFSGEDGWRTAGSIAGSIAGSSLASAGVGLALAGFGLSTGGIGFLALSIGAGFIGGSAGSSLADWMMNQLDKDLQNRSATEDTGKAIIGGETYSQDGQNGTIEGVYYKVRVQSTINAYGRTSGWWLGPVRLVNIERVGNMLNYTFSRNGGEISGLSVRYVFRDYVIIFTRMDDTSAEDDALNGTHPPIYKYHSLSQNTTNNRNFNTNNYYDNSNTNNYYSNYNNYGEGKQHDRFNRDTSNSGDSGTELKNKQDFRFEDGSHYSYWEDNKGNNYWQRNDSGQRNQQTEQRHKEQALQYLNRSKNNSGANNNSSDGNGFGKGTELQSTGLSYNKGFGGETWSSNNKGQTINLSGSQDTQYGSTTTTTTTTNSSSTNAITNNSSATSTGLTTNSRSSSANNQSQTNNSTNGTTNTQTQLTPTTANTTVNDVIITNNDQAITAVKPITDPPITTPSIETKTEANYTELLKQQQDLTTMLATGVGLTYLASQFTNLSNQIASTPPTPCQWPADRGTVIGNQTTANTTLGVITNTQLVGINANVTTVNTRTAQIQTTANTINTRTTAIQTSLTGLVNVVGTAASTGTASLFGFITQAYRSLYLDRVMNILGILMQIHNTAMLSRNVGESIGYLVSNVLGIVGIKDEDYNLLNVNLILGGSVTNFLKRLMGEELYNGTSKNWKKLSAIYTAVVNIYDMLLQNLSGLAEGIQIIGEYSGKVGNALKKGGVVMENAYEWMEENFKIKTGRLGTIERIRNNLENINDTSDNLTEATETIIEAQESVSQINSEVKDIKDSMEALKLIKTETENTNKSNSQSPDITNTDLNSPN